MYSQEKRNKLLDKAYDLYHNDKFTQSREILLKLLDKTSFDHFLCIKISSTYYQQDKALKALEYARKAKNLRPKCPDALFRYASALEYTESSKNTIKAISILKKLLKTNINKITCKNCGKGVKYAKSFLNDCRYEIGTYYQALGENKLAIKYFLLHLENRQKGIPNIVTAKEVNNLISGIKLTNKFYKLYDVDKNEEARKILFKLLKMNPKDHWTLSRISSTYYEDRNYKKALLYAQKAYDISPNCQLVLWDYAGALNGVGNYKQVIIILQELINLGINTIAFRECGEGTKAALSYINDSRYALGYNYQELGNKKMALKYFKLHLKNRQKGIPARNEIRIVRKMIKSLEI